ncbi:hypothetical protein LOD99_2018 [Oopsacas minuta]|uniref:FYVE-type domain-containing protein n=1 Tax=Oopsacas minuta TaxID=111878 RepID=A0AAV7K4Y4_9METZ|nr:hypothetical protein LOD99_2018 [Oopsacas minuta]
MSHCTTCYKKLSGKHPLVCMKCGGIVCKNCPTYPSVGGEDNDKRRVCNNCYKCQNDKITKKTDFNLPSYLQSDPGKERENSYFTHGKQSESDSNIPSAILPKYLQEGGEPPQEVSQKRIQFQLAGTGLSFDGALGIDPRDQQLEDRLNALKETTGEPQVLPTETELRDRLDKLRGFSVDSSYVEGKPGFPLKLIVQSSTDIPEDDLLAQVMAEKEFENAIVHSYSKRDTEFDERKTLFSQNPSLLDELEMMESMDWMQLDDADSEDVRSKPGFRVGTAPLQPSSDQCDPDFDANVQRLIRETMDEVKSDRIVEATAAGVDFQLYERLSQIRGDISASALRPLSPCHFREAKEDPQLEIGDEETFTQVLEAIGYGGGQRVESPRESLFSTD